MKHQKGFTLAELLVAILVTAVILTLLAPVIDEHHFALGRNPPCIRVRYGAKVP